MSMAIRISHPSQSLDYCRLKTWSKVSLCVSSRDYWYCDFYFVDALSLPGLEISLLWPSSCVLGMLCWETETEMEHHTWYHVTYIWLYFSYHLAHDDCNGLLFSILSTDQSAKKIIQILAQECRVAQQTKEVLFQWINLAVKKRRLCLYRVISTASSYTSLPGGKKTALAYVKEKNPLF